MKFLIIPFLVLFSSSIFCQQQIHWIGGAPEAPISWENPRNWSSERVPDESDKVFIQFCDNGHYSMPQLSTDAVINEITIYPNASLTITTTATLTVDGTDWYSNGINLLGGKILNHGQVYLYSIDSEQQKIATQVNFE